MKEVRCKKCNRLMFKVVKKGLFDIDKNTLGQLNEQLSKLTITVDGERFDYIEIFCPKCKYINKF